MHPSPQKRIFQWYQEWYRGMNDSRIITVTNKTKVNRFIQHIYLRYKIVSKEVRKILTKCMEVEAYILLFQRMRLLNASNDIALMDE